MRKFILFLSFLVLTPFVFILDTILLLNISSNSYISKGQNTALYAALPQTQGSFTMEIAETDARVETLRSFLQKYNSPLVSLTEFMILLSDRHNIDYRLLPAIAMQESNLCRKIPKDSYNCWGFGIYGKKVLRFNSYKEAMEAVAKGLEKNYINKGLISPEEIMAKYTPSNQGAWAKSVNLFMEKLSI